MITNRIQRRDRKIRDIFQEWQNDDAPGCVLGIQQEGSLIFSHSIGKANLEHDVPITTRTVFRTGSIAKQFTAVAILSLVLSQKLRLDDHLHHIIPELKFEHNIQIKHLLNHSSGMPNIFALLKEKGYSELEIESVSLDEMIHVLSEHQNLAFVPGSEFQYSNTAFLVLAYLVEQLSGQSLGQYCKIQLFQPLGMHFTQFLENPKQVVINRAHAFEQIDGYYGYSQPQLVRVVGDSGLLSTVEDLLQWQYHLYTGNIEQGKILAMIQDPDLIMLDKNGGYYGMGIWRAEKYGYQTYFHGGKFMGYRGNLFAIPEIDLYISILANLGTIPTGKLLEKVLDLLFDK